MKAEIVVHRIVKETKNPGQYVERHKHSFFQVMYGMSGVECVVVKETKSGGGFEDKCYDLNKGALVIVAPEKIHAIYSETTSLCLSIKFTCSDFLADRILKLPVCIPQVDAFQEMLLHNLFEEAVNQLPDYTDMIDLRLYELFISLHRNSASKEGIGKMIGLPPVSARSVKLTDVLDYIHTHLEEPLSVAKLAEISGYRESYFSSFFKENVGCSPNYYITEKKIERARELMLFSDLNVTMISEKLGYDSIHYFSRVFKKIVGMTPSEYMNRTCAEQAINVVTNQNTPLGEYEIPLKNDGKWSPKSGL